MQHRLVMGSGNARRREGRRDLKKSVQCGHADGLLKRRIFGHDLASRRQGSKERFGITAERDEVPLEELQSAAAQPKVPRRDRIQARRFK